MIEYRCNQGMEKLKASGSVSELLADTCTLIHAIYSSLSEDAADAFKSGFLDNIEAPFMTTEEIEAKTKEKNEKIKEQENCLDELIESLERLVKMIDGEEDSKDGSESDEA